MCASTGTRRPASQTRPARPPPLPHALQDAQQGDRGTASLAEAMRVDRPVEDDRSHTKASDPPTALPQGRDTGGAAATAQGQP
jgi:hypothetical protein